MAVETIKIPSPEAPAAANLRERTFQLGEREIESWGARWPIGYFIFCHTTVTTLILPLAENGAG
jgi:hypothetical protein